MVTKDEFDSMYGTGDRPPRTHTFTDAELERLIAVACREQRYASVDAFSEANPEWQGCAATSIQNAPAPTLSQVMEKYKKEVKE